MVTQRKKSLVQQKSLKEIWELSKDSIGCRVSASSLFEGKLLVEAFQKNKQNILDLENKVQEICLRFEEYQSILSVPGFGPILSAMALGAIGDTCAAHPTALRMESKY